MKTYAEGLLKILITQKTYDAAQKRRNDSINKNPKQTLSFNVYQNKEGFYVFRGVEKKTRYLDFNLITERLLCRIERDEFGKLYVKFFQNSGAETVSLRKVIIQIYEF